MEYNSGHRLQVVELQGDPEIRERIQELGIRRGSRLTFIRRTPFGGPYLFQTSSTLLALREEEMACLQVKSI
ncbi:MAG: ferrous iron transport protein A [Bdellovibrionales bacterium]